MTVARTAEPSAHYERHRPQDSLFYKIVAEYYPAFLEHLHAQGMTLPQHVQKAFEAFLTYGCLEDLPVGTELSLPLARFARTHRAAPPCGSYSCQ